MEVRSRKRRHKYSLLWFQKPIIPEHSQQGWEEVFQIVQWKEVPQVGQYEIFFSGLKIHQLQKDNMLHNLEQTPSFYPCTKEYVCNEIPYTTHELVQWQQAHIDMHVDDYHIDAVRFYMIRDIFIYFLHVAVCMWVLREGTLYLK